MEAMVKCLLTLKPAFSQGLQKKLFAQIIPFLAFLQPASATVPIKHLNCV